ncbi:GNAT family N-acetyltransferase [Halopiger xanaduensis]|uniref:GCN5-related N-acetyltransferase n=1 Tax=Halopiger xanaduensis (strain DSM 18323 / JCM 14033 / SH-6) TaxID=797210 RepID=F8DCU2_HALXS|nr:GNAT family protein [Halopiger xanaduensis]AEH37270.1 GCN5-related N-acetyltransferase [Halopiger xanaduensis SH-6]
MGDVLPETIETDRLRLEALRPESVDTLELYDICSSDPDIEAITEYLTWDPHETPKDTLEFLEHMGEQYESNDGASYVIRPREDEDGASEIAGTGGFGINWEKRTMTLGVWLRKRFWGRGYSGERAAAFVELAFDRLDLELVAVAAHVDNERSNRAIEKYVEAYGGSREGRFWNHVVLNGDPVDCYRYSVSRAEWEAHSTDVAVEFVD